MADVKISALPAATTPLAGTEVLPIVQSSTTKKVSIDNITAGRAISASGVTVSGLTASKPVFTDGSKALTSSGTLATDQGGTGLTSYSQGDLVYYNTGTTLTALPKSTSATRYLANTGTSNNPAWAQIDLSNGVTGILPSANGGTANGFTKFSGPATTEKTFTLPNSSVSLDYLTRAGNVLQVVSAISATVVTTTGQQILTVSITPASTANKILLISQVNMEVTANINAFGSTGYNRNGSQIVVNSAGVGLVSGFTTATSHYACYTTVYLDSPSTTSSTTYGLVVGRGSGNTTSVTTSGNYSLLAIEIAG